MTERVDLAPESLGPAATRPDTMRRHQPTSPFDAEADEAADVTQQFWGATRGWVPRQEASETGNAWGSVDETTGSMQVIRQSLSAFRPRTSDRPSYTGQIPRTRQHGVAADRTPTGQASAESTLGVLASGRTRPVQANARLTPRTDPWFDGSAGDRIDDGTVAPDHEIDDARMVALSPVDALQHRLGLGSVDPLLVRIGGVVLALVLLVPLAMSLRPTDATISTNSSPVPGVSQAAATDAASAAGSGELPTTGGADDASSATAVVAPTAGSGATSTAAAITTALPAAPTTDALAAATAVVDAPASAPATTTGEAAAVEFSQRQDLTADEPATVSEQAERTVPDCSLTYTAGPGDSWYRIAGAADVAPSALLDQNNATVDTVILSGDEICLPSGATVPAPLTTTPATTPASAPPAASSPATTSPSTVAQTTAPPVASTSAPASPAEVQRLIREIWPDDLEEHALDIARRESSFDPMADNGWCCVGVFQIYWKVHQSWLDDYGIVTRDDLFDARKNITAAYAIYQRAGGFGPWGG
ncbi:MAG: LysM peptidoglycan-binding domain-containing protein [Ilumatobacteraceae bacterium]